MLNYKIKYVHIYIYIYIFLISFGYCAIYSFYQSLFYTFIFYFNVYHACF